MAKLPRVNLIQFGRDGSAANFGEFGTLADGTKITTKNLVTLQSNAAWLLGWQSATLANKRPAYQDFNGLQYVHSYMMCYLFQAGIPEWNTDTIYFIGSFCQVAGTVYKSKTDTNTGNNPATDTTNWGTFGTASGLGGAVNFSCFNNTGTPNTKIDIAADYIQIPDSSGNVQRFAAYSKTADCTTVGANGLDAGSLANNTLYAVWAISKLDGTNAVLVSTSFTSPTMPSGYVNKFLFAQARTDGSAHFLKFHQYGRKYSYDATPLIYNASPGAGSWTSVDTSTYISSALAKNGRFVLGAGTSQNSMFSTDGSVSVSITANAPNRITQVAEAGLNPQDYVEGPIITADTVYVLGTGAIVLYCVGFEITSW